MKALQGICIFYLLQTDVL